MGVSASVTVLLEGVLNVMRVKKLVSLAGVVVGVGALATVVGLSAFRASGQTGDRFDPRRQADDGRPIGPDGRPIGPLREPTGAPTVANHRQIVKTYYIGDLIAAKPSPKFAPTPVNDAPQGSVPPPGAQLNLDMSPVIDLITSTVARGSWAVRDGQGKTIAPDEARGPRGRKAVQSLPDGSITPFYLSISLIIRHTPEVHDEVADLLRKLRRLVEAVGNPGVNLDREEQKLVPGEIVPAPQYGVPGAMIPAPQSQSNDPKPVAGDSSNAKPVAPASQDRRLLVLPSADQKAAHSAAPGRS